MTKDERIQIGITKFITKGAKGCLNYVMRFGKTRTALLIIHRYLYNSKDNKDVLIVVPSQAILSGWIEEIEQFNSIYPNSISIENSRITLITVNSLLNNIEHYSKEFGLLVIDEIHKFITDIRIELFKNTIIRYDYILGLTGSYPYNNAIIEQYCPILDKITEAEAIKNKWISNFAEYNIALELTNSDKLEYIEYSKYMGEILYIFKDVYKKVTYNHGKLLFKNDLDVILSCYRGKKVGTDYIKSSHIREIIAVKMGWNTTLDLKNEYYKRIEDYWNPENIKNNVSTFYNYMNRRNIIHNTNEVKLNAVLELYKRFHDKHFIIFSESIEMADYITDAINNYFKEGKAVSYHSKIPSKPLIDLDTGEVITTKQGKVRKFGKTVQLRHIVEGYKRGKYNVISAVNALDEGFNLENIDIVITTSGTANPVTYNQRSARGKTIDYYNPNKLTLIFNLFFNNFVDENGKFYNSRDYSKLKMRQSLKYIKTLRLSDVIER